MVGDDRRFQALAAELGFAWVYARNEPLGRKWNDGYQHACLTLNADYVVPFGSDDVAHPSFFQDLPADERIVCTRQSAIVSPDGSRIALLNIPYEGGDGIRVFPRRVLERLHWRPCLDDRHRAIDGSITTNLTLAGTPPRWLYRNNDPLAIVDFKTTTADQRNTYESCLTFKVAERFDVHDAVAEWHGERFADEIG